MQFHIHQEGPADYTPVEQLIEAAFADIPYSDHQEHLLVARLRRSSAFVPELSLVAKTEAGEILGHILMTKVEIHTQDASHEVLALAPVSVGPAYQGKGVGSKLIWEAHGIAKVLGYRASVLLGHATYYPRFAYKRASNYGISFPFDAPDENCMVAALALPGLEGLKGRVVYPAAWIG